MAASELAPSELSRDGAIARGLSVGTRPGRPFFGQPIAWLGLAVALVMVPIAGWLAQSGWGWARIHPALNAVLNGSSAVFLIAGGLAARRRALGFHRQAMLTALTISGVFLVSYLIRSANHSARSTSGSVIAAMTVWVPRRIR